MSFRRFIYYCAVCGGAAAFIGWVLGKFPPMEASVLLDALKALCLGMLLGAVLAVIDSLWNFSWAKLPVAVLRVIVAGLVGCIAGFFGAMIGSGLTYLTNLSVFQVFGWTLTGLMIGASVGVFDLLVSLVRDRDVHGALRKVLHGLIGGGVGGLLGGVLYLLFLWLLARLFAGRAELLEKLWSPSAIGFVVLGMCIGLLIGLAQVILKEAWLKVEKGFRPGRELIVSKEQVVIGRGEACDIGLFGDNGVERTHARILRKGDRYLLVDADTPGGTYLNGRRIDGPTPLRAGDAIGVGKAIIRFGERQKRTAE
jgi:hypothetical protein